MRIVLAVHQPHFYPWIGWFLKVKAANQFIVLDDVQFSKGSFQNRNKIIFHGKEKWLTVPIIGKKKKPINKLIIGVDWWHVHLAMIRQAYSKSPFYKDVMPVVEKAMSSLMGTFVDDSLYMNRVFFEALFGYKPDWFRSSWYRDVNTDRTGRLIDYCIRSGANIYLAGASSEYLDLGQFREHEIDVEKIAVHGEYDDRLSVVHFLFRYGLQPTKRLNEIFSITRVDR